MRRFYNIDLVVFFNSQAAYKSNPNDEDAMRAIDLMYDAALVSSGFTVSLWLQSILTHSFHFSSEMRC